jgi:hypothetical protein
MSQKKFWLTVFLMVVALVIIGIVFKTVPWWAVLVVAVIFLRLGCLGGRIDARGKPKYGLPDGARFETYFQYGEQGGFGFLLKRIDGRRPQKGYDYFLIREEILDGQTKMPLGGAPAAFRVRRVTSEDKIIYLFYST